MATYTDPDGNTYERDPDLAGMDDATLLTTAKLVAALLMARDGHYTDKPTADVIVELSYRLETRVSYSPEEA